MPIGRCSRLSFLGCSSDRAICEHRRDNRSTYFLGRLERFIGQIKVSMYSAFANIPDFHWCHSSRRSLSYAQHLSTEDSECGKLTRDPSSSDSCTQYRHHQHRWDRSSSHRRLQRVCTHTPGLLMYTTTTIRKISVAGGESKRRRLERAYCTYDVPGERSVDEVSFFFLSYFRLSIFCSLSLFVYAIRVPISVSLRRRPPVVSFHCHYRRFVGPDRQDCARVHFPYAPSFPPSALCQYVLSS